jgi:predicted transcriptional regulator
MDLMLIYEKTIKKLKQQKGKGTFSFIADSVGVSESWLSLMASGKISDPGFFKVKRLIDVLEVIDKSFSDEAPEPTLKIIEEEDDRMSDFINK